jgi:uncharacterized protein
MKTSNYNFIWPVEGSDKAVIFNTFRFAAMEIKKDHLDILEGKKEVTLNLLEEVKKKTALELYKNGFLIEDYVDELKILQYRNASAKFAKETLSLTILPTFACNLKCVYCFQDRNVMKDMPYEIQKEVLQFAAKKIHVAKHLSVCWFGGEPLLEWNVICHMTEKLIKIAEENGADYHAAMVSNGYLFDDEKIQKLKELKIETIQITLDGPPAIHSKRKGIPGDPKENFMKILHIIRKLQQNEVKVNVRINIDKENMEYIEELLDCLAAENFDNIRIYPAQVAAYTEICSNVEGTCLHTEEFDQYETEFYKLLLKKGLLQDFGHALPAIKGNFCCVDQINSFTIAPDGYIYKCWNTIGNKAEAILHVNSKGCTEAERKRMNMQQIKCMTWNPFQEQECLECKYLPLCMGGCPYRSQTMNHNKPECMSMKNNLKEKVLTHYDCRKIESMFQEKY